MSASLTQFLMCLVCDQRTMNVYRHLPSKGIIKSVILRRRGKVFISTYNVCNSHQMVINNIRKIVSRISVRFDKDQILQLIIRNRNISINVIFESCCSFCRHIKTDNVRLTCIQICLYFFFAQSQAVFIIDNNLCTSLSVYFAFQ